MSIIKTLTNIFPSNNKIQTYQDTFELSSDLVLFFDRNLSLIWGNSAFNKFKKEHNIIELSSFIPDELLKKTFDNINNPDDLHEFTFNFGLLHFHAKFSRLKVKDTFALVCDNINHRQSLYNIMYRDPITKIGNLALSIKTVNDFSAEIKENPNAKMLMMGIDFEGFERIDFVYGYEFGDKVLTNFAQQLQDFKEGNIVCRTSGNYILLFHKFEDDNFDIDGFSKQVIDIFDKQIKINDKDSVSISTKIGGAILPKDGKNRNEAINSVKLAQKKAKEYYDRVSLVFYEESFGNRNDYILKIGRKLEEAITNNQLELYYQPKVDVDSKKICGFEALLRWNDPEVGFISPAEFIPISEDTGKIVEIGLWVFHQVCLQINAWNEQGFYFKVSLNVSIRQLQDPDFISSFEGVLNKTGVNRSLIELEITESILSDSLEQITLLFMRIKKLGLNISLDDFGTKYSSLSYLTNLPIDILKIDKSFIKDSCNNTKDSAIVKTIVTLAKELQLKVIAEGVEEPEQVSLLEFIECDYIQGFYYYKPMNVKDINHLLANTYSDKIVSDKIVNC